MLSAYKASLNKKDATPIIEQGSHPIYQRMRVDSHKLLKQHLSLIDNHDHLL